jgi:FkbM family methyltransferase
MNAMDKFAAHLQDCAPQPGWTPGPHPILIYGAGNSGKRAALRLKERGAEIAGFLDAAAKPKQCLVGLPVSTLEDWLSRYDPADHEVFIALSNPVFLPQIPGLRQKMAASGFACSTYHPYELARLTEDVISHFENKALQQYYEQFLPELVRLETLLADEESRQCLVNYMRARCRQESAQYYSPMDQYRPTGLPPWPQALRFIDGGSFTGDTLADFSQHGYRFEAIAAFEPDPENFQHLVSNNTAYENIINFPCALGSKTEHVRFNADGHAGSYISEKGAQSIQCVALDDVLPDFRPNLIKMDIEGAEPEALMGAKNMIMRHRPHLAICLYHRPDHLWRIPFLLDEWQLGYRFYLRQHHPVFELVLYAYPDDSPGFAP